MSALAKDAGSLEKARLVAGSIRGAHAKGRALMEITRALVESGQYRAAEDTAKVHRRTGPADRRAGHPRP
ncbi:hypothetical protein ACQEVZ_48885 [Dactylosporangium sp. CA-152071]|uniref:hypothetical protein n=1 Tax=Dactylosporangium sp. CA-152071 TaxID=3239933 RepID=UPI003D90968B